MSTLITTPQAYYRRHSPITDPGAYRALFDGLPTDVPALMRVVQSLIIHPGWAGAYGITLAPERRDELYLRTLPEMLGRIMELDGAPLTVERPPERRLVGICRDFAVLLVAFLRHQGVPARLRVGFAGYFPAETPRYWDHRIAEYWDAAGGRWVLVDPMIAPAQRAWGQVRCDPLHIDEAAPFYRAGTVWQRCRAGEAEALDYGDSPTDRGLPPIRYALLHDLDALNQVELVGFDAWDTLISQPDDALTPADLAALDRIAAVTTEADARFAELQHLYTTLPYGQAVRARLQAVL